MSERSSSRDTNNQTAQTQGQVQEKVGQAAEKAQNVAQPYLDKAGQMATEQADRSKNQTAGTMSGVADTLRKTAEQMRGQNQVTFANYADQAADRIDHFAGYLQGQSINDLIDEVERFGRDQPVLFIGGAFALGLMGARFLKASRPQQYSRSSAGSQRYTTGSTSRPRDYGSNFPPSYENRAWSQNATFGVPDVSEEAQGSRTSSPRIVDPTSSPATWEDDPRIQTQSRGDSDATR
jgi:hypothetical protein